MTNGSRRYFTYTADDDIDYAVNLDESNAEGFVRLQSAPLDATGQTPLFARSVAPFPSPRPTGLILRGVNTRNALNPLVTKFFKVGTFDASRRLLNAPAVIYAPRLDAPSANPLGDVWIVGSTRPERQGRRPNFFSDTGQLDGDTDTIPGAQ